MSDEGKFYGGTSGLQIPMPKRDFPPEYSDKSRLHFYSTLFNSLEVNSSFYKLPIAKTVNKWTDEVLPGFKFTYKLWRDITHNKGLEFNPADVTSFMNAISPACNHKGCLLIQFPPSITIANKNQLEHLLATISHNNPDNWPLAIEFRHKSWYQDDVYDLLDNYKAGMVIHDMPASASPLEPVSDDFIYLRFHGPDGKYRGSYSDEFLAEYATYINEWLADGKMVYAYFNNTMGNALQNLLTLKSYIT